MTAVRIRRMIWLGAWCSGAVAAWQTPEALQASGIARLDRYMNQVRTSGYQPAALAELRVAAGEFETSYKGFAAASKDAPAAWSLVKAGNCYRQMIMNILVTVTTPDRNQLVAAAGQAARQRYEQAAGLARKSGSPRYLVSALTGLAQIDEVPNRDYQSANQHVSEALRAAPSCPSRECFLDALEIKVAVENDRGELFSAASHVNGLLALLKKDNDPLRSYTAYSDRSSIYRDMAAGCSATVQVSAGVCLNLFDLAKADFQAARELARQRGFPFLVNMAEAETNQLDLLRSMTANASAYAAKVSATLRFEPHTVRDVLATELFASGVKLSPRESEVLGQLREQAGRGMPGYLPIWVDAQMDDLQGRTDAALEGYLRAIRTMEEDRQKLGEGSARSSFVNDKISVYERPVLMLLERKRFAEAFDLLDRSRARATADLLATRSLGLSKQVDQKRFATLALQKAQIAGLQTHFFNGILFPENQDDAETIVKSQALLAKLEGDYEDSLARIARESPRVQDAAISKPVSLESLQSSLRDDPADVLYYHVVESGIVLIHIGPHSFHARNVFLPKFELLQKTAALRNSMRQENAAFREDIARHLFLYLVGPALGWLTTERLIIIPHGELQSLPFQAFLDPASGTFLGERFQITYAPNAAILLQLKKQRNLAGASLLAAGDPALPGAAEEVRTLAHLYPGRQKVVTDALIRKAELQRLAGSYEILHLAVHGKFDAEEPLLSSVSLAGAAGEDGALTAAEMLGLPLEKTRLATLSACETGRVRVTKANDIQGIQQALLFAGAQSLLVSAWKVDSASTSIWMQTFYRQAQTKPPAEAARDAIRAVRARAEYRNPYYWAPFLLIAR